MSVTLNFLIENDYRSGPTIDILESDDPRVDKAFELELDCPTKNKYRFYVINECPNFGDVWSKDLDNEDEYELLYLKLFSQLHDCMPFEVTGHDSAYKDEGFYPKVSDEIKNMPSIDIEYLNTDGYFFVCVIDKNGNEVFTKLLVPIC